MRRIHQRAANVAIVTLACAPATAWVPRGMRGEYPRRGGTAAAIHIAPED